MLKKLIVMFLMFISVVFTEDYLQIAVTPSQQTCVFDEDVEFEIILTSINGFNASANLSSTVGELDTSSFMPPINGVKSKLTVQRENLNTGLNELVISAHNEEVLLGTSTCTVFVQQNLTITPSSLQKSEYGDTAHFTIKISEESKVSILKDDAFCIVKTNSGSVSLDTLNLNSNDNVELSIDAISDYNIAEISFVGNNSGNRLTAQCTTTVKYHWESYTRDNSGLINNIVNCIAFGLDSSTWFGTKYGTSNLKKGEWTSFNTNNSPLNYNDIYDIQTDTSNDVWFHHYEGIDSYENGIWKAMVEHSVVDVALDNKNIWWVATEGGVKRFDGLFWTTFSESNSPLPSNYMYSVKCDSKNNKWFRTSGGLAKFTSEEEWTVYTTSNSPMPKNNSYAYLDKEDNVWFSTNKGATRLDGFSIDNPTVPASSNPINCINGDKNGVMWIISNNNTISKFEDNKWTTYNSDNSPLPSGGLNRVWIAPDNTPWVPSKNGAYKFSGTAWIHYSTQNSILPSDTVKNIYFNGHDVWFATDGGAAKYTALADDDPVRLYNGIETSSPELTFFIAGKELYFNHAGTQGLTLSIFDLKGRLLIEEYYSDKSIGMSSKSLSDFNLSSGIYVFQVESSIQSLKKKIVIH